MTVSNEPERAPAADAIDALLDASGITKYRSLVSELVESALAIGNDGADRGELKLVRTAIAEMHAASEAFKPYAGRRKCAVFGSARTKTDSPAYAAAIEVGRLLTAASWMTITGGGPGIMTAAVEGAGADQALGVTISLPFEKSEASTLLAADHVIAFRYFFTRKLTFMKEASGYILFPGGFGTMDETFELLTLIQTGKEPPAPVILLETEEDRYWRGWKHWVSTELAAAGLISPIDVDLPTICHTPAEAVKAVTDFYRVYHSVRTVGEWLVVRLQRELTDDELAAINERFGSLATDGRIIRTKAMRPEVAGDDLVDLPRIKLRFDNHQFVGLTKMAAALSALDD